MKKYTLLPKTQVQLEGINGPFYISSTRVEIKANPDGLSSDSINSYPFTVTYSESSGNSIGCVLHVSAPYFFAGGRPEAKEGEYQGPFEVVTIQSHSDMPITVAIGFTDKLA